MLPNFYTTKLFYEVDPKTALKSSYRFRKISSQKKNKSAYYW